MFSTYTTFQLQLDSNAKKLRSVNVIALLENSSKYLELTVAHIGRYIMH